MASLTIMPVKNNVFKGGIHVKTSPFGMRNLNGTTRMHNGIDVVAAAFVFLWHIRLCCSVC